jgi:hypothetical protein
MHWNVWGEAKHMHSSGWFFRTISGDQVIIKRVMLDVHDFDPLTKVHFVS